MVKKGRVYLDNASTTPVDARVLGFMSPYFSNEYGNPSSLHREGRVAKKAICESRQKIAKIIGADSKDVIFTSGGTEADNLAIFGIARANSNKGKHIITSAIEHKAVMNSCKKLTKEGFEVTYLNVDKKGQVSINDLVSSLRPDTILVSIMYANNEIGTIQPIEKISKIIKSSKANPVFHTDACQAVGALSIDVRKLGIDAMTISGSKIYGPKGVGCLYLSGGCEIEPIIFGGGQEDNRRSGTENVALIVGFSEGMEIAEEKRLSESARLEKLRDYFLYEIQSRINNTFVNGGMKSRLSNNLNLSIEGVEGESLVLMLDNEGVACSTGSACSSQDLNPSHVLVALGIPLELAHCSVRFSLGRQTTKEDVDYAVRTLEKCVNKIRAMSSLGGV